jgi:hypothetical protein
MRNRECGSFLFELLKWKHVFSQFEKREKNMKGKEKNGT